MPTAPNPVPHRHAACSRTRLAETDIAAVDYCECGHMHLHLGPFSLRITPEALSGLLSTLGQAVASHAALGYGAQRALSEAARATRKRGAA